MGVHRMVLRNQIRGDKGERVIIEEIAYTRDAIHPGVYVISCGDCGQPIGQWESRERQSHIRRDRSLGQMYAQLPEHRCRGTI